ncbi:MAG: ABC transporter permease [Planctomycetota bacterium]
MQFLIETIRLGLNDLLLHKLRSFLTALGIILGVAAVITMVSLGEGSKREALEQIERLGARNIILRSTRPADNNQQQSGQQRSWVVRFGITREDVDVIRASMADADLVVPAKSVGSEILRGEKRRVSQAYGTTPDLPKVASLRIAEGRYLNDTDMEERRLVAVIGQSIAKEMFPLDGPIGQTIRIDDRAVEVIGVLKPVGLSGGAGAALVGRDLNYDVHLPMTTVDTVFGDVVARRQSGSFSAEEVQVSELFVVSPTRERVLSDSSRLERLMEVRHPGLTDVTMIVPFELLENARKSALTWNLVLGSIAGISLLVGGIGIMNIMLATITERTREIGVRRALGATRNDVASQFIVETGVLSALGGVVGVGLGLAASLGIGALVPLLPALPVIGSVFPPDVSLPTHVTLWSVVLAFGVATATGVIFGVYPAMKASRQDPIVALRHD